MSEKVQELIQKIKNEGIEAADQKAKEIETEANTKAQQRLDQANREAEQLIIEAKEEIKKLQESTHMALKQASRDMLLSLRKEIDNTLQRVVTQEVKDSLTPDHLADIIGEVAKGSLGGKSQNGGVEVSVNAKDLTKLKNGFISKLQKKLKQPIKLQSSDDVGKGFTISFDGGKSNYDFTDESLAEFLSTYLNEQVSALVKESV